MIKKVKITIELFFMKIKYILKHRNPEIKNDFYRKQGVKIGKNCLICSDLNYGDESSLIEIGDNTVISTDVKFVLHDFSVSLVIKGTSNIFGKVLIGKNCFIGLGSIIIYGVSLADNIIVAAGSVVTKSFTESNIIIGGNPARKIGDWKSFEEKYKQYANNAIDIKAFILDHPEMLVTK